MQQSTTGFVDALKNGGALLAARITIWQNNLPTSVVFPVSGGSWSADRNSEQRRQATLTVEVPITEVPTTVMINGVEQPFLPLNPASPLSPFGNEVDLDLTIMTGTQPVGTNGWVHLGHYVITTSVANDVTTDLTVNLQMYDRSWIFSKWGLLANYNVPAAGGGLAAEVQALLTYSWNNNGPGRFGTPVPTWLSNMIVIGDPTVSVPTGQYEQGQDPWQAALDMCASAGYQLYMSVVTGGTNVDQHQSYVTIAPVPGSVAGGPLNSLPVAWAFYPGEIDPSGVLTHGSSSIPYSTPEGVSLQMTSDGISNDYFVSATGPNNTTSGPVQSEAADTTPGSPTSINGPLGDIPNFVYDNNITSAAQALGEAQYDLALSVGGAFTMSITTPLHPLLDIDDVIMVTDPRLGLSNQKMIIDNISANFHYAATTILTGRLVMPGM